VEEGEVSPNLIKRTNHFHMNFKFTSILLFFCLVVHSQLKLEGVVTDSLEIPLQSASVVAINKATNGLESYGLTDEKGNYKLKLKGGRWIQNSSEFHRVDYDKRYTSNKRH
jgi:hypothetical protein